MQQMRLTECRWERLHPGIRPGAGRARAISFFGARVLILDEPTPALGVKDSGIGPALHPPGQGPRHRRGPHRTACCSRRGLPLDAVCRGSRVDITIGPKRACLHIRGGRCREWPGGFLLKGGRTSHERTYPFSPSADAHLCCRVVDCDARTSRPRYGSRGFPPWNRRRRLCRPRRPNS